MTISHMSSTSHLQAIQAACDVLQLKGYDQAAYAENMTTCRDLMKETTDKSKICIGLTNSSTEQCACWAEHAITVARIKQLDCQGKKTQKVADDEAGLDAPEDDDEVIGLFHGTEVHNIP